MNEIIRQRCDKENTFLSHDSVIWEQRFSPIIIVLTIIVFALSFIPSLQRHLLPILYCTCGTPIILASVNDMLSGQLSIDTLMAISGVASPFLGRAWEGAFLFLLFFVSKELEKIILTKATDVARLTQLYLPQKVWTYINGELEPIHIQDVEPGRHIVVHAGEMIPLDGIVISGVSEVTTTQLNGELIPTKKSPNDEVFSGSYNQQALLTIRVTKKSSESIVEKMISLITEAKADMPTMQSFLLKMQNLYALGVIITAFSTIVVLTLLNHPIFGPNGSLERSLAVLIALSPCALLVTLPSCYLSSISAYTRKGIIVKGTHVIEKLAKINLVAFDKTGTLTDSNLNVRTWFCWDETGQEVVPSEETLQTVIQLEEQSLHPVGNAIAKDLKKRFNEPFNGIITLSKVDTISGKGILAEKSGRLMCIGDQELVGKCAPENLLKLAMEKGIPWIEQNCTLTYAWINRCFFLFCIEAQVRTSAQKVIQFLHQQKINTLILSGDNSNQVERIAKQLGIKEFYGGLSPKNKLEVIEKLSANHQVMMIGDGVNDSPALAKAQVGIALSGLGNSLATESASIILLDDQIDHIPWIIRHARRNRKLVFQGWAISVLSIILGVFLAVSGKAAIWFSVLLHEGTTIFIALNGLRLLWP